MSTLKTDVLKDVAETVTVNVVDLPASISLRQDLASSADLSKGAALVGRAIRHINSVAELITVDGRYDGDQIHLAGYFAGSPGIGGGLLRWNAASTATPDNGTIFQAVAATGRWIRVAEVAGEVHLDWFGLLNDGVTTEDAKVRAAYAAGDTLIIPDRAITVMLDVPALQGKWPAAANFNRPNTKIVGSKKCLFKLKNFVAAYVDYTGVTAIGTFRVSASNVEISGLNIDANADNHYETVGADKVWEEGPASKRPPSGILIVPDDNAPNVNGVRIRDCKIYRPLQGVYGAGLLSIIGGTSLDDITFFNKTMTTNLVTDLLIEDCEVSYARGNDFIFISGVSDSRMLHNVSKNSMYHSYRFYAGVESCFMEGNSAYTNYGEIAARWNPTDLGYWRTDNPAGVGAAGYLIERSGYAIGSTAAQTSANSGNIRRCGMRNNSMWYSANTETGSIVDTAQPTLGSFFVWQVVNGIDISNNESHNTPFNGLVFINSILSLNPVSQGVIFHNNRVDNSAQEFIYNLGVGTIFTNNEGSNCTIDGNGKGVIFCQGGAKIYLNNLAWQRTTANANDIIKFTTYGTVGLPFISDNRVFGYTGTRINKLSTDIVHGTDGGGVPLTLLAGWTAGSEALTITVNCAGYVVVQGRINSAAGGTDTYASLNGNLAMYRPAVNIRYPTWQSTTPGVVEGLATAAGSLAAARGALAAATPFAVTASWKVDLRLPT